MPASQFLAGDVESVAAVRGERLSGYDQGLADEGIGVAAIARIFRENPLDSLIKIGFVHFILVRANGWRAMP